MKLNITALCDIGCLRTNNEDMISINGTLIRNSHFQMSVELNDDNVFYTLVSDGMGGHECGEFASEYTLTHFNKSMQILQIDEANIEDTLRLELYKISDKLNTMAIERQQCRPMGCTLTGLVWCNSKIFLLNSGDSRTYRLRNGFLRQLTIDDTEQGKTGNPNASKLLLNCIGGGSNGSVSINDISELLLEDDKILICSDGLSDMVSEDEMEFLLATSDNDAVSLLECAKQKGGVDNISIIIIKIS